MTLPQGPKDPVLPTLMLILKVKPLEISYMYILTWMFGPIFVQATKIEGTILYFLFEIKHLWNFDKTFAQKHHVSILFQGTWPLAPRIEVYQKLSRLGKY